MAGGVLSPAVLSPAVRVDVDPALAEAAVQRVLARANTLGIAPDRVSDHRRRLDRVYALEPSVRDTAFGQVARETFDDLDLFGPVRTALAERPDLAERVEVVFVGEAGGRFDDGVTCESGGTHVGIRLEARRFEDRGRLLAWARHALGHAEDTLDPGFEFRPRWDEELRGLGGGASVGRVHHLWDVTIDARLASAGQVSPGAALRQHRAVLAADLPDVAAEGIALVVDRLWSRPRPVFPQLLGWARLPASLIEEAAPGLAARPRPDRCPLCGFPGDDVNVPDAAVAAAVSGEYPAWRPTDGVCSRCSDRYRFTTTLGGRA